MSPSHGAVTSTHSEDTPLLSGRKPKPTSLARRLHRHMTVEVSRGWADLILLYSYIVTGLLDSSAVFIWGAFVSMQTGNTIYLGLGFVDPSASSRWILSAVSIGTFCAGCFLFSGYHRFFGPRRRWVLLLSFAVQTALIAASAIMVALDETEGKTTHWHVLVPLAMLAFQSSGQAVASRALQYNSLTGIVLTSIYIDLFGDANLFAGPTQNVERNRRAAAPLLILVGAVGGGFWAHSSIGMAGALWTAVGLKSLILIAWMVWKEDPKAEEDD